MRDGWRETTLGAFLTPVRRIAAVSPDAEYKFVTLPVKGAGARLRKVVRGADVGSAKYIVRSGDLMISKIDARKGSNSLLPEDLDGAIVTGDFLSYEVDHSQVRRDYLDVLVRRAQFSELCDTVSSGTTNRVRLDPKRFLELTIVVPPLNEQRRIVDLIAAVDGAVDAAEAEAGATLSLLQAALDVHLDQAESMRSIADIALQPRGLVGGPFGSSLVSADYRDTGVPIIRGTNMPGFLGTYVGGDFAFVDPSKADALSGNLALPGDVVFTQRGTIGQVGMVPDDEHSRYVVSQSQMRLRVDPALSTPEYVRFVFTAPAMVSALRAQDRATANPHINLGVLAKTEVPVPPLHVQDALVSDWGALQSAAEAARATANALRALRSNLLTVLLSGEHEIPSSYDVLLEEVA